jgi:CRISPR system Cascade subunit CasE
MYLSRTQLQISKLTPEMLEKWNSATSYASHQWLWQLFPEQDTRQFLFRQELNGRFFILSARPPSTRHSLFIVETKAFRPQIEKGMMLDFQLRANPVVTRNKKRSDVMMDAKYQAKANGVPPEQWWERQQESAQAWLEKQGNMHGFRLLNPTFDDFSHWAGPEYADSNIASRSACIGAYQQHRIARRSEENPIVFSSVDYAGGLCVTDVSLFEQALFQGLGKCKGLGCGLLMVKRRP